MSAIKEHQLSQAYDTWVCAGGSGAAFASYSSGMLPHLDHLDDAGLQWLETLANTDNFHTLVTAFCIRHEIKPPKLKEFA